MNYQPPKRIFEDTGYVDPKKSYHVHIDNVVNCHNQDLKTLITLIDQVHESFHKGA